MPWRVSANMKYFDLLVLKVFRAQLTDSIIVLRSVSEDVLVVELQVKVKE